MEVLVILLVLGIIIVVFVLPIWAINKANRTGEELERLRHRLSSMEAQLHRLTQTPPPQTPLETESQLAPEESEIQRETTPVSRVTDELQAPPILGSAASEPITARTIQASPVEGLPSLTSPRPPGLPPPLLAESESSDVPPPQPAFSFDKIKGTLNWEQFMGAKLYAWIGGLALFLAAGYFIKHSFEKGWIPPELRVAMGFLLGLGLIVGGVLMRRKEYTIMSHTLCATGVLVLYAVTFACRAVYHFPFFGTGPTFALMALITAAGFTLAVRLEARPVAVLGMLGGFLTPILLSTGQDALLALFAYIGLLDAGLLAVAVHRRWFFLVPMAALGTMMMQVGWAARFFEAGRYFADNKILLPMTVLLGGNALWLGAMKLAQRRENRELAISGSALGLALVAFLFAFYFQTFPPLAARPWLLLGFAFVLDAVVLAISRLDRRLATAFPLAGMAVFAYLANWLNTSVTNPLLPAALAFTLIFALAHTLLPLALQRLDGGAASTPKWTMFFPALALLALLIPIFKLSELTVLVWPVILLVDILAVALAAATLSVLPVMITLVLTLLAAVGVLFKIPSELTGLPTMLIVVAVCAFFFVAAGVWLSRKVPSGGGPEPVSKVAEAEVLLAAQIPVFAVVLPFLLLVMIVVRLQLLNPSPVFGLALLLVGMLFAVTKMFRLPWLPLIGLACVAALEHAWHLRLFKPESAPIALAWYLTFLAVFAAYPFVLRKEFTNATGPWIASALAGPAQFYLVHHLVRIAWPNHMMGLLAAAFAVPSLASLVMALRSLSADARTRQTQLALFGGAALFFITLIVPLQFSRQWITISWALEGAALCWLFHRVPHPGLRLTGVGLLITSFARLALNPAVLSYHVRSETPILNWYLYTYGAATAAMFVAARLLAPPRDQVMGSSAPPILATLGTILAFLLVNIEIADFFTAPGERFLTFKFSGNFARDMSYSVAWALFALGLLIAGLARKLRPVRYAALALLGATVVKLFFHDLARLDALYRVGALVAVAVVALLASFLYQKFISSQVQADENKSSKSPAP
jgi:uncharacterized membrane protein